MAVDRQIKRNPAVQATVRRIVEGSPDLRKSAEKFTQLKRRVGSQRALGILGIILKTTGAGLSGRPVGDLSKFFPKFGSTDAQLAAKRAQVREEQTGIIESMEGARQFKQDLMQKVGKSRDSQMSSMFNAISSMYNTYSTNLTSASKKRADIGLESVKSKLDEIKGLKILEKEDLDYNPIIQDVVAKVDADKLRIPSGQSELDGTQWQLINRALADSKLPDGAKMDTLNEIGKKIGIGVREGEPDLVEMANVQAGAKTSALSAWPKTIIGQLKDDYNNYNLKTVARRDLLKDVEKETTALSGIVTSAGLPGAGQLQKMAGAFTGLGNAKTQEEADDIIKHLTGQLEAEGDDDPIQKARNAQLRNLKLMEESFAADLGTKPVKEAFRRMENSEDVAKLQAELALPENGGYQLEKRDVVRLVLRNARMQLRIKGEQSGEDLASLTSIIKAGKNVISDAPEEQAAKREAKTESEAKKEPTVAVETEDIEVTPEFDKSGLGKDHPDHGKWGSDKGYGATLTDGANYDAEQAIKKAQTDRLEKLKAEEEKAIGKPLIYQGGYSDSRWDE